MFTAANLYLLWRLSRLKHTLSKDKALLQAVHFISEQKHDDGGLILSRNGADTNCCNHEVLFKSGKYVLVRTPAPPVITLDEWTAYMTPQCSNQTSDEDLYVQLSTSKPENEDNFLQDVLAIPTETRVQLLNICRPWAWKSGEQFSILCACTRMNLSRLISAIFEETLTLDELLEINCVQTVSVTGTAKTLLPTELTNKLEEDKIPFYSNSSFSDFSSSQTLQGGDNPNMAAEAMFPAVVESDDDEFFSDLNKRDKNKEKSPNVLIYTGKKFSESLFSTLKSSIQTVVGVDQYTIYHLKHDEVIKSPWTRNCALLIIASDKLYEGVDAAFDEYFRNSGVILSCCSVFDELYTRTVLNDDPNSVKVCDTMIGKTQSSLLQGRTHYENTECKLSDCKLSVLGYNSNQQPVTLRGKHSSGGIAVFTQIHVELSRSECSFNETIRDELSTDELRVDTFKYLLTKLGIKPTSEPKIIIPDITPAYVITTSQQCADDFVSAISKAHKSKIDDNTCVLNEGQILLDFTNYQPDEQIFDVQKYRSVLGSKNHVGNTVIFQKVTSSTQTLAQCIQTCIPDNCGLLVTADQQVKGIGRGGNAWISPLGSIAMTYMQRFDLDSNIGRAPALIQTIPAIALCELYNKRIQRTEYYRHDHMIRLKWPNDIYINNQKVGGVIVTASTLSNRLTTLTGIGVNMSNANPTTSVNSLITEYNECTSSHVEPFKKEEFLALMCREIQAVTELFQRDKQEYYNLYYKYWVHSGNRVDYQTEDGSRHENALILGLDESGFLLLKDNSTDSTFSVQPDSNSFDIRAGLIKPKTS